MKKWKKILLTLFVIGIVTAGIILYIAFKKPLTAADTKPVKEFSSEQLIGEIEKDRKLADSVYMFKNIGVSGKIKEISGSSIILDAGEGASINCSFDSATFAKSSAEFKAGATVKIKGIYYASDGFDVVADPDDLLASITEKNAKLRTCAINQ